MTVTAGPDLFADYYGFAVWVARDTGAPDPEDVAAGVMVAIATSTDGGASIQSPRAYIRSAVQREAWRQINRARRHTTLEEFDAGAVEFAHTDDALQAALAGLPERWRTVIQLTVVEGFKPPEVGAMLGIPPNAVSALAYRARRELRTRYINSISEECD